SPGRSPPSSSREVLADPLRRRRVNSSPIPFLRRAVTPPIPPSSSGAPRGSVGADPHPPGRRRRSCISSVPSSPIPRLPRAVTPPILASPRPRQWRLRRSPSTTDNDNATPLPPQEPPLPIRTHATVPPAPKGTGHPSPPLPHP
uniref:Uncharacterized protein n=1 Tax=Oryza rufipogon TaxID=4529 RepID=A0A0E0RGI1_ORYRU